MAKQHEVHEVTSLMTNLLEKLAEEARACTLCAAHLPLGPRPVFRTSHTARLLIIGQAPGTKVHASGIPFDDASGERLRGWMGIGRERAYDTLMRIAIMPMGFCYPGRFPKGGDLPPLKECAPAWHEKFLHLMPQIELTLLVGTYAALLSVPRQHDRSGAGAYAHRIIPASCAAAPVVAHARLGGE